MKLLTLMRHAKSSRDDPTLADIDRPLAELGRRQASAMGVYMKERGIGPDCIVCSPSLRTRETFELLLPYFPKAAVSLSNRLYNAPPETILAEICAAPHDALRLLIIGHNPGIRLLALALADPARSNKQAVGRIEVGFKSGALAHFEVDIKRWDDAEEGRGALLFYTTPKDVMS